MMFPAVEKEKMIKVFDNLNEDDVMLYNNYFAEPGTDYKVILAAINFINDVKMLPAEEREFLRNMEINN